MTKNGHNKGRQLYKCHACGRQFLGGERKNAQVIFQEYLNGKQTYEQLANRYGCSPKTIQRYIDKASTHKGNVFQSKANVILDTTYFGHNLGVMVFKNSLDGSILLKKYVKEETIAAYLSGVAAIATRGIKVQAIISDGKEGIVNAFPDIPLQLCQFHQVKTITTYLTRKPKLESEKELRWLSLQLKSLSRSGFQAGLDKWYDKWKDVLNERSINRKTGKTCYTHKKLRSAYHSLVRNLPHLYVFEDFPDLDIPNTTNALDGLYSNLKNKLRNHNGLSLERKKKLIDEFFEA